MSALNIAEEMNVALPERAATTTTHATRPFFWSIRRELWENPSVLVAPAAVACFIILATLLAAVRYPGQLMPFGMPYRAAPSTGAVTGILGIALFAIPIFLGITMVGVAVFYSLDALYSERRDRSIFFWKSLPVSDTTTVLSKMAVPMALLPIITFVVAIAAQLILFIVANIVLLAHHESLRSAWAAVPMLSLLGVFIYGLTVVTLWYAPIYAWLIFVSSWARRVPLLWAVIPFFLLSLFEQIGLHTRHVNGFISNRFNGVLQAAFSNYHTSHSNVDVHPAPGHFLATPGLWLGLLFTALVLILIIRLRRSSDPI